MMEKAAQEKLLNINQAFYDQYAASFSVTRGRIQPGVRRMINQIGQEEAVLDVGCGNGTFAQALAACGFSGRYLGLDMSKGLLSEAASGVEDSKKGNYQFQQVDMSVPEWAAGIPGAPYDWLVCFAVLHHLPGKGLREQVVRLFTRLVTPESQIAVSVWQWHNSPRLRKRVHPWSEVGLERESLDTGDVLLDWRAGETIGLRYVHTFDEDELSTLAQSAGFQVQQTFYSDGKPGNLALYQVWRLTT